MSAEDELVEDIVRQELDEGLSHIERAGFTGGTVVSHRDGMTTGRMFEIGGRFESCPDRSVYATVEIDPARVGWRLEATLWEYPDADSSDHAICNLGMARTSTLESATQHARILATAAWVAVKDYLADQQDGKE